MGTKQIQIVIVSTVVILLIASVLLAKKGVSCGFKEQEDEKDNSDDMANKVLAFFFVFFLLLVGARYCESLVGSANMSADTFNAITTTCYVGALISWLASLYFLSRWCSMKCNKRWPWISSYVVGSISVFPVIYLLTEVKKNSKKQLPKEQTV
jgi:hypothetical protein